MSSLPVLTVAVEQLADPLADADEGRVLVLDRFSQILALLRRGLSASRELFLSGRCGVTLEVVEEVVCVRC